MKFCLSVWNAFVVTLVVVCVGLCVNGNEMNLHNLLAISFVRWAACYPQQV